mgnify:CR=1 FL=1
MRLGRSTSTDISDDLNRPLSIVWNDKIQYIFIIQGLVSIKSKESIRLMVDIGDISIQRALKDPSGRRSARSLYFFLLS